MINWPIEQPILVSDSELGRVTLRPPREEDIASVYQACQDPTIPAFTRVPSPYFKEHAEDFVRGSAIGYLNRSSITFVIDVDGVLAGAIDLHAINLSDHCAEVGYWIEKSHRGKGLCTNAVRTLLDFALNIMEFRRVEGLADFDNSGSQRVMERAGMVRDGLLRNRVTKPNGDQIDMVLFSKVRD